ncbi:MAG: SUMF1/EgtB/PvdO family nonheme iron enzyme [Gemmataceae bacterium]
MIGVEETLLTALLNDPADLVGWFALADWHEENDRLREAEFLRIQISLSGQLDAPDRSEKESRQCQLLAEGLVPPTPSYELWLRRGLSMRFQLLPPGEFWMGSDDNPSARGQEGPRHKVSLSRPFLLAATPVTQSQWYAVMRTRPAMFRGSNRPVERVNWDDAVEFCQTLSRRTGLKFRLPTEAEWEFACRAGISAAYYHGQKDQVEAIAWFGHRTTQAVGKLRPNGWGLYDMLGNVWEWTADAFRNYPRRGLPRRNPHNCRRSSYRVARGGSYSNPENCCRSAARICFAAGGRNDFIGFRPVLEWPLAAQR